MEKPKIIGPWKKHSGPGYAPCPVCGGEVIGTCRCFRADSECENGHKFHICVKHQVYVHGSVSHKIPIDQCTCGQNEPRVPPGAAMSDWRERCRRFDKPPEELTPEQRETLVKIEGALAKVLKPFVGAANTDTTRAAMEAHLRPVLERLCGERPPIDIKFKVIESGKDRMAIIPENDETAALLDSLNRRLGDASA